MTEEGRGRIWIRLIKKNHSLQDAVVPAPRDEPEAALREALATLDISQPMWLPRHRLDWGEYAFTRFLPEHFVDSVPFDRLEVSYLFPENEEKPVRRKRSILEDV